MHTFSDIGLSGTFNVKDVTSVTIQKSVAVFSDTSSYCVTANMNHKSTAGTTVSVLLLPFMLLEPTSMGIMPGNTSYSCEFTTLDIAEKEVDSILRKKANCTCE
jgi:hypothetical protein